MEAHIGNVTCWKKHMVQLTNRINSKWAGLEKTSHSSYMVCLWQAVTVKLQVSPWFVLNNCYRVRCLKQPGSNKLSETMYKSWTKNSYGYEKNMTITCHKLLQWSTGIYVTWVHDMKEPLKASCKETGLEEPLKASCKETRLEEPTEGILQKKQD